MSAAGLAQLSLVAGAWWELADFNRDDKPDYLLFNSTTHATAIWYMNNNVHVGGGTGPTIPGGWSLVGVADFNRDDKPDYLLFNSTTHPHSNLVHEQQCSCRRRDLAQLSLVAGAWWGVADLIATTNRIICCLTQRHTPQQSGT